MRRKAMWHGTQTFHGCPKARLGVGELGVEVVLGLRRGAG
jgi:hypothetical protein